MSDGNDRTDSGDDPPDDGVLDPDDLDIRERDEVYERGEGRYVISTGAGGVEVEERRTNDGPTRPEDGPSGPPDERPHLDALAAELDALSAPYGLALAGRADDETASIQVAATDPADVLGAAVRWYAEQVDPSSDADETAAALLTAAGIDAGDDTDDGTDEDAE
ncbi:hypothetical protein HUG10_06690 [Halorarum halophilum]|uniref:Uncharacterized protein n=1 Tax=Halorarum halophilum TaxID=2743090 RepID=A0A7D5GWV6_9EURY|nr:hypothetical protein [Halobaculum halophilum]QLG27249.1 hypothetical protein HUG10_06690 [Halobaculum halophilum]